MNNSVAEDWEDLFDVCEPHAINLQPFNRVPTSSAPLNQEDELLSGDEDLIDPENSKKLNGMVTYTLRSLGNDFTNNSIETAFGMNGVLLRSIEPEKPEINPQSDKTELQKENIDELSCESETVLNEKTQQCVSTELDVNIPNQSTPTTADNITKKTAQNDQLTFTRMASIARRVKRNAALSSIMARLMNRQDSEAINKLPASNTVDESISDSLIKTELKLSEVILDTEFDSTKESKVTNFESRIDKDISDELCVTSPPSPTASSQYIIKDTYNIVDNLCSQPSTSNACSVDQNDTVPPVKKSDKIMLNAESAKKTQVRQSAAEIYKLLMEKRNAMKPGLSAHYSSDCNSCKETEVKPKTMTMFDIVKAQLEKKRKRK